jgi:hypothetical protein
MKRVALRLGLAAAGAARADAGVTPALDSEARLLGCGPRARVDLSVFRWTEEGGRPVIRRSTGHGVTGRPAQPSRPGKPVPGCPNGLPLPSADWHLAPVERWTSDERGQWTDSRGRPATVSCARLSVRAVENATALVPNPKSDGCAGENQLILSGGPRVEVEVTRCRLVTAGETFVLTFGVERVASTNDCGGGADWRVVREPTPAP